MTQIFFYHDAVDRLGATAALIGKAVARNKSLIVYAPEAEMATALDRHLWQQPPTGFVPHVDAGSPLAAETPVVIARDLETIIHDERLFNFSNQVPPGFSRFTSLIEVVGLDAAERLAARERVKYYKDRGYGIQYFDLSEGTA
ncbi:MAG TPA: DNA polymerase III subunit chi [Accumulibacter sp.]|nr:DNA polymerase III subunit chi [Accumulibacter sp.]HMW16941.1 DNA polymerase III subunit chi [Accumulibacter sp.]HMX22784.1 DNA polymerase III subunit chi [Accumulibacter sp.]HMY06476.1 DNA polymerase III subunit chi [Accumulibacter sp.]HNC17408.1 DNA polymerase III subunit chi [Accumulibacter sp.]